MMANQGLRVQPKAEGPTPSTLHRALRRMAGLVFLLVFWVLAGACQRHGVGGFLLCNTTTTPPRAPARSRAVLLKKCFGAFRIMAFRFCVQFFQTPAAEAKTADRLRSRQSGRELRRRIRRSRDPRPCPEGDAAKRERLPRSLAATASLGGEAAPARSPRAPRARVLTPQRPPKSRPYPFAPVRTSTHQTPSRRESHHRAEVAEARPRAARRHVMRPQPPRRARRRPPRAQLAAAPHVTAPAQSEPTRRPRERRRAASESSTLIAPPASPSVRRSPSAPRACGRSRRAERADAPLELSLLLLLTSPRRLNQSQHDDRESAAEPRTSRRP